MTTKEKRAAYQKAWRQRQTPEKQEEIRAQIREWHQINRTEQNVKRRNHYTRNRDYYLRMFKANGEKRKSLPDFKEKQAHYRKRAKAVRRSRQASGNFTLDDWRWLLDLYENKCAYCDMELMQPTQDHVIPLSKGGTHTLSNIVPACMKCNQKKNAQDVETFLNGMPK